jgi:predicted metal-binding protein
MYVKVNPVIDHSVRALCALPYPGHENGCPNYGTRDICPPNAPFFNEWFDLKRPVYAVYITFDLAAHVQKLRASHPHWTEKQVQDWNLWHVEARDALRASITEFLADHPDYTVVKCPEAMGVNITETVKAAGIQLEWQQPIKTIHRIALAGVRLLDKGDGSYCPRNPLSK